MITTYEDIMDKTIPNRHSLKRKFNSDDTKGLYKFIIEEIKEFAKDIDNDKVIELYAKILLNNYIEAVMSNKINKIFQKIP